MTANPFKKELCMMMGVLGKGVLRFVLFDDAYSYRFTHIPNGKSSKRRIILESLHTHGLGWNHINNTCLTRFTRFWILLNNFTSSLVHESHKFIESASDVRRMTIENWSVTSHNFVRMIKYNDLSKEMISFCWRILLSITGNHTTSNLLQGNIFDIESNIVSWSSLFHCLMMHFNRFNFCCQHSRSESNIHSWFDDTSLNTSDRHSSNTTNLVNILKWKTERFVDRPFGWLNSIKSFEHIWSFVPRHVLRRFKHIITNPTRNRNKWNFFWFVTNSLQKLFHLLPDLFESTFTVFNRFVVHFIDEANHLLHT